MKWPDNWEKTLAQPTPDQLVKATGLTAGYMTIPQDAFFQLYSRRPLFSVFQADLMLIDQQVWFGVCVGNSPLMSAEVRVKGPNGTVNAEVLATWNKIWSTCASKILRAKYYGYCGSEVNWKLEGGYLEFADLLDRHPRDTTPLVWEGEVLGIAVRGMRGKDTTPVPEPQCLRGMKGLWLTYESEFGSRFGRPILERAYGAWYDKATSGGAYDLRRLRCMKDAWIGDLVRYPLNFTITLPNGQVLTGKDIAREISENRASGGTTALPSDTDDKGNLLFDYVPPQTIGTSDVIQKWIEDLDWNIFDGLLIPREVVEAASSGSGFSGRSIPLLMFLGIRDVEFANYVRHVDKQLIRPMIFWNHGAEAAQSYEVEPVPLIETVSKQLADSSVGGEAVGGEKGGGEKRSNYSSGFRESDTDGHESGSNKSQADAMQFSVVHAPEGGVTIKGTQYKGGEFIPGEVIESASPAEREAALGGKQQKSTASRSEMVGAKRVGTGKEAKLVLDNGKAAPSHLKAGMVPPQWTDVKVSTDPEADVLITARDKAGRTKTVYSQRYADTQAAAKFYRTREMLVKADRLHAQNQANRQSKDAATREAADCIWLMEEQATRPGSDKDTKAKVKAFGATTLRAEHVVKTDEGVRLKFVGKEGVFHDHLIRDPALSKMLLERKKTAASRGGRLFDTDYGKLLKYAHTLDGGGFSPKDFRTKRANELAIAEIQKYREPPKTKKEYVARVKEVATAVSHVLGNRPSQAVESYIDPSLWSAWKVA